MGVSSEDNLGVGVNVHVIFAPWVGCVVNRGGRYQISEGLADSAVNHRAFMLGMGVVPYTDTDHKSTNSCTISGLVNPSMHGSSGGPTWSNQLTYCFHTHL